MTDKELILEKAKYFDVITFDVFDTLLIRDVMVPADIFTLSYGLLGRYVRILAEMKARKKSESGEVTLEDIDKLCVFSCLKELDLEKKYCRANPVMLEVYRSLKESGKKMYAISDMYLSSEFIGNLLKEYGIDIPVIVSCEENASKKDGSLFKIFLNRFSLSAGSVLHIGDSINSDGEGAGKAGIDSLIIEKHSDILSYTRYSRKDPELSSFINHGLNELSDPVERLGYEIVGPIILSFCQWVNAMNKEFGFDRLYFLARDMRFAYEMYRNLYPEDDARYLCVSRRSLRFAQEHPEEMCEFLKKEDFYGNVSIVDTGWIGNAQVELDKYSKMIDTSSDIGGLYLGSKLAFRKLVRSKKSRIFLYSSLFEQFKCQLFPPFMETLIGCNEKQVIAYKNGLPVFDRDESRDQTNRIKSGAQRFIEDWNGIKKEESIHYGFLKESFEKLFYCPKKSHIELIGKLHYEDYNDSSIVSYDDECCYVLHPLRFLKDLGNSGWKGAFLKKTGIMYFALLFLYFWIGALRLYLNDCKSV
jgi:predicted HAD superfamily hydrolase